MNAPKVGALFAGYGGLELAVSDVFPDAHPAWVAEFEDAPSRILAQRFPDVPNLGDVTKVKWAPDCPACGGGMAVYRPGGAATGPDAFYWCAACERQWDVAVRFDDPDAHLIPEPVEIVTGGSPCQDLSHAGKRAGMRAGTRSGLWASMCDAIETIRPSLVVWENVRGALSAEADSAVEPCPICVGDGSGVSLRALGRVLGDLAELGYDAAWTGIRAADVGAPHGRFRVFVLAWPADAAGYPRWLGDGNGGAAAELGRRAAGVNLLPSPRTSDTNGAGMHGSGGMDLRTAVSLLPTPAVNDMGASYDIEKWDAWTARMKAAHGNGNGHGNSLHIEALRMLPTPKATNNENRQSLDRYGMNLGQALGVTPLDKELDDALPAEAGPGEVLPDVRSTADPEAVRERTPRGSGGVPAQGGLLAGVREHEGDSLEGRAPLASEEAPSLLVPGVRDDEPVARAPHRPEPGEQRSVESGDSVRVVSPAPALAGGPGEAACGCAAWAHYAPAIHRWEVTLGRRAPAPTEPTGKGGAHRLSARAVEFMMGLPDGWVTDTDTTRNEQLKALGNGVVPQQAAAAIRRLLTIRELALGLEMAA